MKPNEIFVIYGNSPKAMVLEVLKQIQPENEIDWDALIGIKPNLVVAKPAGSGATTSPELVAGVIEYLQEKGFSKIIIMEGSWVGEQTRRAFRICGYEELAKRYQVPLIDLQKDKYRNCDSGGLKINICDQVMAVDYLINMPVLKGHCQTKMTCALKNVKGCIPDAEKRRFHTLGLHQPIAHLNKIIRQSLIIVDGLMGDLNFEEGGNPVSMNRVIAGKDPVLIDSYAATLLGYGFEEIPYIGMAEQLGIGSSDLAKAVIMELNKDLQPEPLNCPRAVQRLAAYVVSQDACSACYGSLIHALDRLMDKGILEGSGLTFHIGQGYKGQRGGGIGAGSCAGGFENHIIGCPLKARDVVEYVTHHDIGEG